jgi:hypothetical protein
MKKITLILLLISINTYGSGWVQVSKTVEQDVEYVDLYSIRKTNDRVTLWRMVNFSKKKENGALSVKEHVLINCKTKEIQTMYQIAYSELDSKGARSSFQFENPPWKPIMPNTNGDALMKFTCER